MGNSNSSQHHPHHQPRPYGHGHPRHGQGYHPYAAAAGGGEWTNHHPSCPLEDPAFSRNRMKRGYFQGGSRAYGPPPHKVLPQPVGNPNKILKATSNGAILHGGGTISGRKLSELELEIRKRGGGAGNGMSSGRSTPNLLMPRVGPGLAPQQLFPSGSNSSRSRDYGSEPDLRVIGGGGEDEGSGSGQSPIPNSFTLISESPAKKQIRSRKKSKAPPPPPGTQIYHPYPPPQSMQYPVQYSSPGGVGGGGQRSSTSFAAAAAPPSTPKSRLFKTKAEAKSASSASASPALRHHAHASPLTTNKSNKSNELSQKQKQNTKSANGKKEGGAAERKKEIGKEKTGEKIEKKNKAPEKPEVKGDGGKKTFYFGMEMGAAGTFKQKQGEGVAVASAVGGQKVDPTHIVDLHKEISRRKMLQKLDSESRSSSRSSKKIPQHSESDSDGMHRRQDSGSFELIDKAMGGPGSGSAAASSTRNKKPMDAVNGGGGVPRESSSDLSSSELDVPLVVTRPTLPQKRPELPRFSPTAAWRAIDSPASNGSSTADGRASFDSFGDAVGARRGAERSGDSGISAGDANSPAVPPLLEEDDQMLVQHPKSPLPHTSSSSAAPRGKKGADRLMKCWTPEQDLDESSSDFDQENDPPCAAIAMQKTPSSRHLFEGKRAVAVVSDSDSKYYASKWDEKRGSSGNKRFHAKHYKGGGGGGGGLSSRPLDSNWFLTRSEPNSLNYLGLPGSPSSSLPPTAPHPPSTSSDYFRRKKKKEADEELECELELEEESSSSTDHKNKKPALSSEIGYGPSSMNFKTSSAKASPSKGAPAAYEVKEKALAVGGEETDEEELMRDDLFDYLDQYEEGEFEREQINDWDECGGKVAGAAVSSSEEPRPFSHHIMYLPSYDAKASFAQGSGWRRTRSVDHLDQEAEVMRMEDRKISAPSYLQGGGGGNGWDSTKITTSRIPPCSDEEGGEAARRAANKKKFKFQSTLRVLERKKIEAELSREARQREEERLREVEEMKRVEEEFQRKRRDREAKEKEESERVGKNLFQKTSGSHPSKQTTQVQVHPQKGQKKQSLSERTEPEGAAAASPPTDLRKELISASKKRSGGGGHVTQELSEYRQENNRRQYCDYRSRLQSSSPARIAKKSSSSSDVFPMRRKKGGGGSSSGVSVGGASKRSTSSTVHPEVVCDIPVKPYPYMVNASRLGGGSNTTMNLLASSSASSELERPVSMLGGRCSSPSIASRDNYRKDWAVAGAPFAVAAPRGVAHHGRASSVISLHSAPPNDSCFYRNGEIQQQQQRLGASRFVQRFPGERPSGRRNNFISRQYSASPPPSESPVPSSSTATDSFNHLSDKSSSNRGISPIRLSSTSNTTIISIGPKYGHLPPKSSSISPAAAPGPSNHFQPQPYSGSRGYRPVVFKPSRSQAPPATAVN